MRRYQTGFAPSSLCYDPVTMGIAAVAMGVGTVYQGYSADKAAKRQASAIEEQAMIAREEARAKADAKAVERRRFLAEQRMAYAATGVTLEGTPSIVQGDTWEEFQLEIEALRRAGTAQFGFLMNEAATTRSTGRAQLVSSIFKGGSMIATGMSGVFSGGGLTSSQGLTGSAAQSGTVGSGAGSGFSMATPSGYSGSVTAFP